MQYWISHKWHQSSVDQFHPDPHVTMALCVPVPSFFRIYRLNLSRLSYRWRGLWINSKSFKSDDIFDQLFHSRHDLNQFVDICIRFYMEAGLCFRNPGIDGIQVAEGCSPRPVEGEWTSGEVCPSRSRLRSARKRTECRSTACRFTDMTTSRADKERY